ncbi:rhodanese-like domain-containing protein [uncultured Acetobacteroides sp.]|uniref:rhodanese-like domain-containing protein n=1 Tax=uncultured Acetobacteroides sp. TaxID=1760811 RepID=UPI0029F57FE5|nr:rhodanese-like domain-containing protein [uncultured Acetobacteroides sp.]
MGFFSNLFGTAPKVDFKELVARGAIIIDVRTPQEFSTGNIKGSVNIPVSALPHRVGSLSKQKPIIVYCASGSRSASAKGFLDQQGFAEVYNGGSYRALYRHLNE